MTYLWPAGEPITVQHDRLATPEVLIWQGRRHPVQAVSKRWRVDQGWWRRRVWREYFQLITRTGLMLVIYREVETGQWFLQRLYD
ncbi:MAG: hypothetical protein AB1801_01020 [Chloroflexota bacterium]